MFSELETLLNYVKDPTSPKLVYFQAICEDNCLGKRSVKNRYLTYRHLLGLYGLDPCYLLFKALRFFWSRDTKGRVLLSLLCAYSRDGILRSSTPFFLKIGHNHLVHRESLEEFLDALQPERFSKSTLRSTAQNLNSTFTQTGHLKGYRVKIRSQASPTPGSIAFALLLGYARGERGAALFQSEYISLLDCPLDVALDLASEASQRGWLIFKRIGNVIEVLFPNLLPVGDLEDKHG
ncbi:MAG: hypothetical protein VKL42_05130 [Snowella sp.]|nr:hypothetical protein [Snowella sp.]